MRRTFRAALAALVVFGCAVSPAAATSRIKDLANIEGVRQNQLIGYGLVVGLNGTGDTLNNAPFTKQSLQAMLERLGVNIRGQQIRTGNVAAVMVTADLPPFATQGTRIDVTASAMGDAKSLRGRHASGHAAAWRRRQRLCGRAGLACPSAAFRPRAKPPRSPAAYRPSGDFPTAPSSSARSNSRSTASANCGSPCATPTSRRPSASPSRDQRLYRRADRRTARSVDRATHAAEEISAEHRPPC